MGENKSNSAIWTAVITGVFALCGTIVTFLVAPVYLERMRASQTQTAVAATVAANSQPFSPPTAQVQPSATPFAPPTLDYTDTIRRSTSTGDTHIAHRAPSTGNL